MAHVIFRIGNDELILGKVQIEDGENAGAWRRSGENIEFNGPVVRTVTDAVGTFTGRPTEGIITISREVPPGTGRLPLAEIAGKSRDWSSEIFGNPEDWPRVTLVEDKIIRNILHDTTYYHAGRITVVRWSLCWNGPEKRPQETLELTTMGWTKTVVATGQSVEMKLPGWEMNLPG